METIEKLYLKLIDKLQEEFGSDNCIYLSYKDFYYYFDSFLEITDHYEKKGLIVNMEMLRNFAENILKFSWDNKSLDIDKKIIEFQKKYKYYSLSNILTILPKQVASESGVVKELFTMLVEEKTLDPDMLCQYYARYSDIYQIEVNIKADALLDHLLQANKDSLIYNPCILEKVIEKSEINIEIYEYLFFFFKIEKDNPYIEDEIRDSINRVKEMLKVKCEKLSLEKTIGLPENKKNTIKI